MTAAGHHDTIEFASHKDWDYAVNMVETVAWLAGQADYLDDLRRASPCV